MIIREGKVGEEMVKAAKAGRKGNNGQKRTPNMGQEPVEQRSKGSKHAGF